MLLAGEMNDVQTYNGDMILSLLLCVYVVVAMLVVVIALIVVILSAMRCPVGVGWGLDVKNRSLSILQ